MSALQRSMPRMSGISPGNLALTLGARYDDVDYEVTDRTGGGGSGQADFTQFSPMAGLLWSIRPGMKLYGNISRAFDPPTTPNWLIPEGPTGFNQDLDPQTATNYELGVKGLLVARARYELALFHIDVKDAIVPFELAGSGQSFFENAGRSTHRGLEAALSMELLPGSDGFGHLHLVGFYFRRVPGCGW